MPISHSPCRRRSIGPLPSCCIRAGMEAEVRRTHLPGDLYVTFMATIFPLVRFIRRVGRHSLALPPAVPLRRSVRLYVSKLGSPSVRPSVLFRANTHPPWPSSSRPSGRRDVQRRTCGRPLAGGRTDGRGGSRTWTGAGDTTFFG